MARSIVYMKSVAARVFVFVLAVFSVLLLLGQGGKDARAVPTFPFPQQVTQADGAVITITGYGDEYFSWVEDSNGHVIAYDDQTDNWCYAYITQEGEMLAGSSVTGVGGYMARNLTPWLTKADLMPLIEDAASKRGGMTVPSAGAQSFGAYTTGSVMASSSITNPEPTLLVILVEYNDVQIVNSMPYWQTYYFGENSSDNSVNNYFKEVSNNTFKYKPAVFTGGNNVINSPSGSVSRIEFSGGIAKVKLNKNHPGFDPDPDPDENLVYDDLSAAFDAIKAYVDGISALPRYYSAVRASEFSVATVLAGWENANSANSSRPQRVHAHAVPRRFVGDDVLLSLDFSNPSDIKLLTYVTQGEIYAGDMDSSSIPMGIGVTAHELCHALGLPDLYDTTYASEGAGPYSLMAAGSWGAANGAYPSHTPVHLDAWSKAKLGFVTPQTVNAGDSSTVTLNSIGISTNDYNVLKLVNPSYPDEYFIVENRGLYDYDGGLWVFGIRSANNNDGGVMIYHVDESRVDSRGWLTNDDVAHKSVDVEEADNSAAMDERRQGNPPYASYEHFFVNDSGGNNRFASDTTPNSKFHNGTETQDADSGIALTVLDPKGASMRVAAGQSNYAISLSETGTVILPHAYEGQYSGVSRTVTVNNNGTQSIDLTVELTGVNSSDFNLSISSLSGVTPGGQVTFNVGPKDGLTVGEYTATITVSNAQELISESFDISFEVMSASFTPLGDGSQGDPYIIQTAGQLAWMAEQINNGTSPYAEDRKYWELGADIDLSAYGIGWNSGNGWIPIGEGNNNAEFKGHFDGKGFVISNLTIDLTSGGSSAFAGLFGSVNGSEIKNVALVNASITVNSTGDLHVYAGGICGFASDAVFSNCSFEGSINGSIVSNASGSPETAGAYIGGICGYAKDTDITSCLNTGSVTAYANANNQGVNAVASAGGICGFAYDYSIINTIDNSYNTGAVSAEANAALIGGGTALSAAGGIAGIADSNSYGSTITYCYSTGEITATSAGGILGHAYTGSGEVDVKNSAAINPGVKGSIAGRITGNEADVLADNYAFRGMLDKDDSKAAWTDKTTSGKDGVDICISKILSGTDFWVTELGWDTSIWLIENNKLPTLKNMSTNPLAAQDSTPPTYLTLRDITLPAAEVTIAAGPHEFTGSQIFPAVTVKWQGNTLSPEDGYTAVITSTDGSGTSAGTNAGTVTVTITGTCDYTGSVTRTYEIVDTSTPQQPSGYTVTYNLNGGSGTAPTETSKTAGAVFQAASDAGVTPPPGKYFLHWNEDSNGAGASYQPGDDITMPAQNLTLYAMWDNLTYTVSFETDGGTTVGSYTGILYNETIIPPAVPTKQGYQFSGWYKESGLLNEWDFGIDVVTGDITLYAKWTEPVTVTGVTVSPTAAVLEPGDTQQFTALAAGTGNPPQTFTWTVTGGVSAGTVITSGGLLTVGADETAALLTVTAESTADTSKSGSAAVTVNPVTDPGTGNQPTTPSQPIIYPPSSVPYNTVTISGAGTGSQGGGNHAPGTRVTISAGAPKTGYEFSHWTASPAVDFDDAYSETTTFVMPYSGVTITAHYISAHVFVDVNSSDWFYDDVMWAYKNGLMTGIGMQMFNPMGVITNAECATVLARLAKVDYAKYSNIFTSDMSDNPWYRGPITWARAEGLHVYYPGSPLEVISRGEIAVLFEKYMRWIFNLKLMPPNDPYTFTDTGNMTAEEVRAFQILYGIGIFKGDNGVTMYPLRTVTRAEFAALIHRLSAEI